MNWHSWHEFWAMGGYALYVWGSVGVVFALLAAEWAALVWRRQAVLGDLALVRQVKLSASRSTRRQRKSAQRSAA